VTIYKPTLPLVTATLILGLLATLAARGSTRVKNKKVRPLRYHVAAFFVPLGEAGWRMATGSEWDGGFRQRCLIAASDDAQACWEEYTALVHAAAEDLP